MSHTKDFLRVLRDFAKHPFGAVVFINKGAAIHEAGIAQNVINIVERAAAANNLAQVSQVVLEVGQFSGVEVHALEMAFSALCKGTVLEGARIEYQTPFLLLYCKDCQTEYLGDGEELRCPICEGEHFRVVQGRELIVKSITAKE